MSHAWGEVIQDGKVVGHYEYNGTCDVCLPRIYDTHKEVMDNWRSEQSATASCTCGDPPSDVILYSDYGDGFYWPAKACLKCRAIVGDLAPYYGDEDEYDPPKKGHPIRGNLRRADPPAP
jgi:hypothetical protein